MIDRWGVPIYVGWADHEIIWLQAAMTLDHGERLAAYQDIASMTGRSLTAVKQKVSAILLNARRMRAQADAEVLRNRTILVPAQSTKGPGQYCEIRQPTRAQLMAWR